MLSTILIVFALILLYWFPVRHWFATGGTTAEDRHRMMAGDAIIARSTHCATQAVTINAPPELVWPWLVQMGYQRGGLYSYDWLDRLFGFLDHPSATRIIPELQHLVVGDTVHLGPHEALTVAGAEPFRALVLSHDARGFQWVWQFGLYPLPENRTRLVSRGTERFPKTLEFWIYLRVMEPAAFIMTRRMLWGVKRRAEGLRASASGSVPARDSGPVMGAPSVGPGA